MALAFSILRRSFRVHRNAEQLFSSSTRIFWKKSSSLSTSNTSLISLPCTRSKKSIILGQPWLSSSIASSSFHCDTNAITARCDNRHFSSSNNGNKSGTYYAEDTELSVSQKVQEIVKAELCGLTGSNTRYESLLQSLEESKKNMDIILREHEEGEKSQNGIDMIVQSMQNVADAYMTLGMLDEAQGVQEEVLSHQLSLYSNSSESQDENDGNVNMPDHEDIARTMHTIGVIQLRLQNYDESQKWLHTSLAMKKRIYNNKPTRGVDANPKPNINAAENLDGMCHYEIGKTLNSLAILRIQSSSNSNRNDEEYALDQMKEAIQHYRYHDSKGLNEENIDLQGIESEMANHPDVASISENMAMMYRNENNFELAVSSYEKALRIHNLLPSDNHDKLVSLSIDIGDCLKALDLYEDALVHYQNALYLHTELLGNSSSHESAPNDNANDTSGDDNNTSLVEQTQVTKATVGTILEGILRHNIGLIHANEKRYEEALQQYQISLSIKKNLLGDVHPEVAKTFNALGAVCVSLRNGSQALSHFNNALKIYRSLVQGEYEDSEAEENIVRTLKNIELAEEQLFFRARGEKHS